MSLDGGDPKIMSASVYGYLEEEIGSCCNIGATGPYNDPELWELPMDLDD